MVKVGKLTDYGTLILIQMAKRPEETMTAAQLSKITFLNTPTVSKLLKTLAQHDLLQSFRGAQGGYRLARPASEIGLLEIVEILEGPLSVTDCNKGPGHCDLESVCHAKDHWHFINDVLHDTLKNISLEAMCRSTHRLKGVTEHERK